MQALTRFERIYRENFAFVWAAARRCGAPAQSFDGLVQGVFLSAFLRRDELPYEISERAWLYGITRRAVDKQRAAANSPGRPARDGAARQLEDVLGRMGQQTREVLVLAELLEMTGPEIASELQLPVAEVRGRLTKARGWLAQELSEARADQALAAVRREDQPPNKAMHEVWAAIGPALRKAGTKPTQAEPTPLTTRAFFSVAVVAFGFVGVSLVRSIDVGPEEEEVEDLTAQVGPSQVAEAAVGPDSSQLFGKTKPEDERVWLEEAELALTTDRPSAALRKVQRHQAAFPSSPLAATREATRARALCRLGRIDEGTQAAASVLAADPESNLGKVAQSECATQAGTPAAAPGTPPPTPAPDGTTPAGTTPAGAAPAGTTPAGAAPAGTTPTGAAPAGTTPTGAAPAGTAPAGTAPPATTTPASPPPASP